MYVSTSSSEKDNLLRAIRFETPDYIPVTFHINDACWTHYDQNALLDLVDGLSFLLIDAALASIGILEGRFIVVVIKDGRELGTVDGRDTLVSCRIFDVLDTVTTEHNGPIGLSIGGIIVEDLFIDSHRFVEVVVSAEMVGAIIEIGASIVIQAR